MPRAAELKVTTKFDGRAVDNGLKATEAKLTGFERVVGSKLAGALMSVFSAEKLIQFGRKVDEVAMKIGNMVDKLREGKDIPGILGDIEKTGATKEEAGFADAYAQDRNRMKVQIDRALLGVLRAGIAGFLGTNPNMQRMFSGLYWASITPQAKRVDRAVEAGNAESDRLSTVAWIQKNESDTPNKTQEKPMFSFPSNDLLKVQTNMLAEIQQLNRKMNPRSYELLQRKTMFPE